MPSDFFTLAGMKKHPIMYGAGLGLGPLSMAAGGLFGKDVGNFFTGSRGRVQQAQRFNPQQQSALMQLLSMGMQNANPDALEQRARSQFNTTTVPGIAERFTNMGSGAQRSSAFNQQLGLAGSNLEEQLAALRSQYGLQQTQMGMQSPYENFYQAGQPGLIQQLLGALTKVGGNYAMGGM